MRIIVSLLFMLILTACAGTAPTKREESAVAFLKNKAWIAPPPFQNISKQKAFDNQAIELDVIEEPPYAEDGDVNLWSRIRSGFGMPNLDTDLAEDRTHWYAARPDYLERMIYRSKKYLFHIVEALEHRGMPTELALLPFVESAYNPQLLSTAKAAGIWQFIPSTGKSYNLKQNIFQDERRDLLASTTAALDYLSKLYDQFGDWHLALAAYNWGEGNVQRAIDRNQLKGLPTDYVSLRMPTETRYYVPKLQAMKNIIACPEQYGLNLPVIPNQPYFVSVSTKRDIDLALAAKLADLPLDEFCALNPSFRKPLILGAVKPKILLPFDSAEVFQRRLKDYDKPLSSWTTYTSSSRERPEDIALKLGIDALVLRRVNSIPPRVRLKAGSTLLVPRSNSVDGDISKSVVSNAVLAVEPDVPCTRRVLVRARKRDTLTAIASRSGVSVAQIKNFNRLRSTRVSPGQLLVLHVPVVPVPPRLVAARKVINTASRVTRTACCKNKSEVIKVQANRSMSSTVNTKFKQKGKTPAAKVKKNIGKAAKAIHR